METSYINHEIKKKKKKKKKGGAPPAERNLLTSSINIQNGT